MRVCSTGGLPTAHARPLLQVHVSLAHRRCRPYCCCAAIGRAGCASTAPQHGGCIVYRPVVCPVTRSARKHWEKTLVGSEYAPVQPRHICTGTWPTPATSAPGLGSPLPHLHRDWALPCHICTEARLNPSPHICTGDRGSPLPHLQRDPIPATSAPGLSGLSLPAPPDPAADQPIFHVR